MITLTVNGVRPTFDGEPTTRQAVAPLRGFVAHTLTATSHSTAAMAAAACSAWTS